MKKLLGIMLMLLIGAMLSIQPVSGVAIAVDDDVGIEYVMSSRNVDLTVYTADKPFIWPAQSSYLIYSKSKSQSLACLDQAILLNESIDLYRCHQVTSNTANTRTNPPWIHSRTTKKGPTWTGTGELLNRM